MLKTFVFNTYPNVPSAPSFTSIDERIVLTGIAPPLQTIGFGWYGFTLDLDKIGSGIVGSINVAGISTLYCVIYPNEELGFSYIGSTRVQ